MAATENSDRCEDRNPNSGHRCILEKLHFGPHEDTNTVTWGDYPQCPVSLPSGFRCAMRHRHDGPHKIYSGSKFIEMTDEDVRRIQTEMRLGDEENVYDETYRKRSTDVVHVRQEPGKPLSLAHRLFKILDAADTRPFVPISQNLIKEIIIALPDEYVR